MKWFVLFALACATLVSFSNGETYVYIEDGYDLDNPSPYIYYNKSGNIASGERDLKFHYWLPTKLQSVTLGVATAEDRNSPRLFFDKEHQIVHAIFEEYQDSVGQFVLTVREYQDNNTTECL